MKTVDSREPKRKEWLAVSGISKPETFAGSVLFFLFCPPHLRRNTLAVAQLRGVSIHAHTCYSNPDGPN